MIWATLSIIIGLIALIGVERVRRNPELLRKGYMVRYTHSIVLLIYATRLSNEEVRKVLAENAAIRKKYLIETYIICAVCLFGGIGIIIFGR
jgi:hypothetical protein